MSVKRERNSKSHLLYECNMQLQKAYAEVTRLESRLREAEALLLRAYRHGIFADGLLGPDIAMFIREIK